MDIYSGSHTFSDGTVLTWYSVEYRGYFIEWNDDNDPARWWIGGVTRRLYTDQYGIFDSCGDSRDRANSLEDAKAFINEYENPEAV